MVCPMIVSDLTTLVLHSGNLTLLARKWTRIESMYFLLKMEIFHCHVSLPEGAIFWIPLMFFLYKPYLRFLVETETFNKNSDGYRAAFPWVFFCCCLPLGFEWPFIFSPTFQNAGHPAGYT